MTATTEIKSKIPFNNSNVHIPPIFILVGRQATGKTYTAKQLLEQSGMVGCILDVTNEYDPIKNIIFTDYNLFIQYVKSEQCKSKFILIDESTGFVSLNRTAKEQMELIRLITQIRHRGGNTLLFCFHSLASVSNFLLELSGGGYMKLFLTNDDEKKIEQSRPKFLKYLQKVKATQQPLWINLNEI